MVCELDPPANTAASGQPVSSPPRRRSTPAELADETAASRRYALGQPRLFHTHRLSLSNHPLLHCSSVRAVIYSHCEIVNSAYELHFSHIWRVTSFYIVLYCIVSCFMRSLSVGLFTGEILFSVNRRSIRSDAVRMQSGQLQLRIGSLASAQLLVARISEVTFASAFRA